VLTRQDDLRHDLGSDELARESLYWNVALPDEKLILIGYAFLTASGDTGVLGAALGEDVASPLALHLTPGAGFEGTDLDNFSAGPLRVLQPEALRTCSLEYAHDGLSFTVDFEALHDAFDYDSNTGGNPPGAATNRFEQGGRVRGSFDVRGRSGTFEGTGWRDHSWGPRDWKLMQHYKLISITAEPDLSINVLRCFAGGEVYLNGFVARDGELAALTGADIRTEFDDDYHQCAVELELLDEAGRRTRVTGDRVMGGRIPFGGIELNFAGCTFEVDGRPARGTLEYMWPEGYREHAAQAYMSTRQTV
jgi:hypothetical protein